MGAYTGSKGTHTKKYMQLVSHGSPKEAPGDGGNLGHSRQLNGPWQDPLGKVGDTAYYENAFNDTKLLGFLPLSWCLLDFS